MPSSNPKTRQPDDKRGPMMETDRTRNTPGTDMQAEDTGTASSGSTGATANRADAAMKQEHKTRDESGSGR